MSRAADIATQLDRAIADPIETVDQLGEDLDAYAEIKRILAAETLRFVEAVIDALDGPTADEPRRTTRERFAHIDRALTPLDAVIPLCPARPAEGAVRRYPPRMARTR